MFDIFRKKTQDVLGYPYIRLQKAFQLYSSLYRPFEPGSMPDDSIDNPLALVKGIAGVGLLPELSDALEHPQTKIEDVIYLRNKNDDWVVYGQCALPDPKGKEPPMERVFMMMFGTNHIQNNDQSDSYFMPYFVFDALCANTLEQALLVPRTVATLLKAEPDDLQMKEHDFPGELGQAICFADNVFCQILAGEKIDFAECQKWIHEYSDQMCAQKLDYIHSRSFDLLKAQIRENKAGDGMGTSFPQPA